MITISAFADEIAPDLKTQIAVCAANGVRSIDVRGIDNTNVSKFTLAQAKAYRRQLDDAGFTVPCVGSPLGKIRIDEDFAAHLDLLRHCCDLAAVLGSRRIRIFSFYPPVGGNIAEHRREVMDRLGAMVAAAKAAGVVLLHENEKAIYGAKPDGVKDIFKTVRDESFGGIFDPANYVEEGIAPYDDGWTKGLAELTQHVHIKDKRPGEEVCVPAGTGNGQFEQIFGDLKRRGYDGVMTLEPHLSKAGQFSGYTGPELFATAVDALKGLLDKCGLKYME